MVFSTADEPALAKYKDRIRKQTTQQLLMSNPQKVPFDGPAEHFKTQSEMHFEMQCILNMSDAAEFCAACDGWAKTVAVIKEFTKNLGRAAADVSGHVKSLETKAKNAKEKEEKEKQKVEVTKAREDAKAAAEQVRQNMKQASPVSSFFTVDFEKAAVPLIKILEGDAAKNASSDEPFLLTKNNEQKLWAGSSAVDKFLASYAGAYKKAKDVKAAGRGQIPINELKPRMRQPSS